MDRDLCRRIDLELACHLTEDELMDRARMQAREVELMHAVQAEKKQMTAELGAREKQHVTEIHRLASIVTSGIEFRGVECEEAVDFRLGVVTVVRLDTGEVVRRRPLTAHEKQGQFAFSD